MEFNVMTWHSWDGIIAIVVIGALSILSSIFYIQWRIAQSKLNKTLNSFKGQDD
jgi:hypothetical protein